MLVALSIRDIVLIDKLDLAFEPGLTVFTGETGAGKSIILDSLGLALGLRGDAGLVRQGASQGVITASFDLPPQHGLNETLKSHDFGDGGDGLILRRVQYADGRSKAFINDRPVSTALLRQIGSALVEIHGQHDGRALLDAATHRELLDAFGGLTGQVRELSTLWQTWRQAETQARELEQELDQAQREIDFLTAASNELKELAPKPGEEEELAVKRHALQASSKVKEDLESAIALLTAPDFPETKLSAILRRLERTSGVGDAVKPINGALERLLIEAQEARAQAQAYLRGNTDTSLEQIEERLFALRAMARKHRVTVEGLYELNERLQAKLDGLHAGVERVREAQKAVTRAAQTYNKAAKILSETRRNAASELEGAVQKGLKPLKLEKAKFMIDLEKSGETYEGVIGGPNGAESVVFCVQTNPGSKPGPLMKVASGGELARFLLALKVVLAEKNTAPVLVFDEIDTGVGGATASAIGERLARLGQKAQVLAVTHSPQVAASADAHFRLYKTARSENDAVSVETNAEALDATGRQEEIARMLAGHEVTKEARAAARRLMGGKHGAAAE